MKKQLNFSLGLALFLMVLGLSSCEEKNNPRVINPGNPPMVDLTVLGEGNQLYFFKNGEINSPASSISIRGLSAGEVILSIDYRPATGQLYGVSSASRIYMINENSGQATALGTQAFSPSIEGTRVSLDFNPTVDRIRLVTDTGQNLRLHPETGAVVAVDGRINGGMNPKISGVAYTNSVSGATSTTLYDIDLTQDKLYKQMPPNEGGLMEVGNLGVDFDGPTSFDINPDNTIALAVSRTTPNQYRLYQIILETGQANWVGRFKENVLGIAFKTNPIAYAADGNGMLYRFNPANPEPTMVAFQGLEMGEQVLGLDFRPANGQLLAVTNRNQLYGVNTSNGMLTKIGMPFSPGIDGDKVGFDFNPTVDRIRLVTEKGQNLRLHPDLGTVVATDGRLNPGSPMVDAAAYTKSFAGTTSTTLFVIDFATDMLYQQNPPNDGVLVPIGSLGIDVQDGNGFDIGGTSDMAYGVFRVNNSTGVYSINLMTGRATKISDLSLNPTAMALGLGF
ncbi:DUF4394 domain-containing protein [Algoriphagus mannitolivorans]|uniref:DUF4394 domain-containing protein n=1 Tax=Algoriphagus mannitolivorans TaxID=226504 RepID=UPI000421321F|nr:DUF4394 domain-containing protein [Algoriphagus mannitolivorans]